MAEEEKKFMSLCLYGTLWLWQFLCENQLEGNMLTDHANVIHA